MPRRSNKRSNKKSKRKSRSFGHKMSDKEIRENALVMEELRHLKKISACIDSGVMNPFDFALHMNDNITFLVDTFFIDADLPGFEAIHITVPACPTNVGETIKYKDLGRFSFQPSGIITVI